MKGRKTPSRIERRDIGAEKPQVTDDGKIYGLAIPFGSWTTIGSGAKSFRERVAPGAVTKTLREADTVYLDNHDTSKPIARKSAGTLEITARTRGAEFTAEPVDTTYARDLVTNIRAGNTRGNSFGFEVVRESWGRGDDGVEERTLLEIKLPEISACTFPAYLDTEIGMRDAYEAAMESRAAKATYADLETCGECGATGQYGAYCGGCGEPMRSENPSGDFCTKCGSALDDSTRSSHACESRGKKPYGNVAYADSKNGKYPIDTLKHVKAAWAYINKAKNAAKYPLNGVTLASVKAKIKAAAKKFGIKISSDRDFADFELRGYNPATGFTETRQDAGDYAEAIQEVIDHLDAGNADAAKQALQDLLDSADDEDADDMETEDSSGMVAHTTPAGASVPVRTGTEIGVVVEVRTVQRVYDLVCELTPTAQSNEALRILEPLLEAPETPPADAGGGKSKPDSSTSAITRDSDLGREMEKRFERTQSVYRP